MSLRTAMNDSHKTSYNVLAELYRFLAQFDSIELYEASRQSRLSRHMRIALTSLAREIGGDRRAKGRSGSEQLSSNSSPVISVVRPGMDPQKARKKLHQYFADPKHFPTKDSLGEFASRVGLTFRIDPKSGKPRTVNRLVRMLLADQTAMERAAQEMGVRRDPETQGWFDLILRSKP